MELSVVTLNNQLTLKEIRIEKLGNCGLTVRVYTYNIYTDSMGHIFDDKCLTS